MWTDCGFRVVDDSRKFFVRRREGRYGTVIGILVIEFRLGSIIKLKRGEIVERGILRYRDC